MNSRPHPANPFHHHPLITIYLQQFRARIASRRVFLSFPSTFRSAPCRVRDQSLFRVVQSRERRMFLCRWLRPGLPSLVIKETWNYRDIYIKERLLGLEAVSPQFYQSTRPCRTNIPEKWVRGRNNMGGWVGVIDRLEFVSRSKGLYGRGFFIFLCVNFAIQPFRRVWNDDPNNASLSLSMSLSISLPYIYPSQRSVMWCETKSPRGPKRKKRKTWRGNEEGKKTQEREPQKQ